VPGVITTELAERAGVRPGGTVTLGTAAGDQPVTVAAVVRALPATEPGREGILVDLPTLTERRLAAGGADAESVLPAEWWTAARDSRTAPAVRALAAHPDWGKVEGDRVALRERLRDSPLGAALQGALVLGFGAALSFAAIAFAVNAAVSSGERAREFSVLRTLGVRTRQVAGMLAIEQAFLVALGLAGGTVLGLVVARLTVRHIVAGVQAGPSYPPATLVVPWPLVGAVLGGVAAMLAGTITLVIMVLRRRGTGAGLRAGEER
jgi:predicted lysophospholipase L1 biosynthesis ABC-type transport system permease subunit